MKAQERLLVVLAHPDDESFICGGTLAKIIKRGGHVTLLCATKGEMGRRLGNSLLATRESLPQLREQELRNACDDLGISDLRFMNIRDKTVEFKEVDFIVDYILDVIQEIQPQVMLTFDEQYGGHPDHCAIGRAATLAFKKAKTRYNIPLQKLYFVLWHAIHKKITNKYDLKRIMEVDITETLPEKIKALKSHHSQTVVFQELWDEIKPNLPFLGDYEYILQAKIEEERDFFQNIDLNNAF